MLASSSEKELEIVRDLSRTYPSHVYYQQRQGPGQRSLFNVLRAYSVYDRQARRTPSRETSPSGGGVAVPMLPNCSLLRRRSRCCGMPIWE